LNTLVLRIISNVNFYKTFLPGSIERQTPASAFSECAT
jgi:hypothetical protein